MKKVYRVWDESGQVLILAERTGEAARNYAEKITFMIGAVNVEELLTSQGWGVVLLKDVKPGEYFQVVRRDKNIPGKYNAVGPVYVRGAYDRGSRRYDCVKFEDIGQSRGFYGSTWVTTEMTF